MSLLRWLPTFLAFPLGGLITMLLFGGSSGPLVALFGGAIVGAVIGLAQWLALGRVAGARWFLATTGAVAVGGALAWLLFGPPVTMAAAALTGLVVGALVGIAQALVMSAKSILRAVWAVVVTLSWGIGWMVTAAVIVDLDRGHFVFGSSGAAVVTLITGVALRLILGRRTRRTPAPVAEMQEA